MKHNIIKTISTATLPLIFIACGGGGGGGGPSAPSIPTITPNPGGGSGSSGGGGAVAPGPSGGGNAGSGGGSTGGGGGGSVITSTGGYPLDPLRKQITLSPILTRPTQSTTNSIKTLSVASNLFGIEESRYRFKSVKEYITSNVSIKSDTALINQTRKIGVIDSDFATSSALIGSDANRLQTNLGCGTSWSCTATAQGTKSAHGTLVAGTIMQNNRTATIYGYTAGNSTSSILNYSADNYGAAYQQGVRIFNGSFGSNVEESIIKSQG